MTLSLIGAFNRGRLSRLAMARIDLLRTPLSAEVQTNWMPRQLGSMMLRPGLQYIGETRNNLRSWSLPFVFSRDDTARLEITENVMRVWVADTLVSRPAVSAVVVNGDFAADLFGWTDLDIGGAVSSWSAGSLSLVGTANSFAKRRQTVSVANLNIRHALNILVARGPVSIRVGSTAGADDYIAETELQTGSHSLAFTPSGDFHIDLFSYGESASFIDSIQVAPAGVMELATPWLENDINKIRWDQSNDVIFAACSGHRQRRIERRAIDSWSVVLYESNDGPFMVQNVGPITLTPSSESGDITLTASQPIFTAGQIGALFKVVQSGQSVNVEFTGDNQFSNPIRVTGVDGARVFAVILSGTWVATVTLQYSVSAPGDWVDAPAGSFTTNDGLSYDDTFDNQIIFYRIGVKPGNYTSGTVEATLSYQSGTQTGVARVTGFVSSTIVNAATIKPFGGAVASPDWSESYWSARRGYPSSAVLYEGRLWWAGMDRIWGSVSDAFSTFDDETEGDSGPISRSIGSGPVNSVHWMVAGQRLLIGADGSIFSARSSSFDEPLTPTNFNIKDVSTQGAANVLPVKIDTSTVFVQRAGQRVYDAIYDGSGTDYAVGELTGHIPEMGAPGIIRSAVQRQPETRVHFVRTDGTVALMVIDRQEEINCWIDIETDGFVEDVCILPGEEEDKVYYTVARTVGGVTKRYHERMAMETECIGGIINKQADSFVVGTGAGSTVTGLQHLEGREVVCWADGVDKGVFTVTGGAIPCPYTAAYVVGLHYRARYKSTKLAYAVENSLNQRKRVSQIGFIAVNLHARGLKYGPDFDHLDDMPPSERYEEVSVDSVWTAYDEENIAMGGNWSTDSRICLEANAPRPCTLLSVMVGLQVNDK